jgi:hypothetical protein
MKKLIVIPAAIEGISTRRDKSLKIIIGSQELTPEQSVEIMRLNQMTCYVAFKPEIFLTDECERIEKLQAELDFSYKTPSQRLRNILFVMWQQNPEGYTDSELHYRYYIDKICEHYKSKLLPR